MLLFAHTGITLGLALGAEKALGKRGPFFIRNEQVREVANPSPLVAQPSHLATAAALIDYRLVLLGSMLPDIIDKPLGIYGFGGGRSLAHTLLFVLLILLVGLYRYFRSARLGILVLSLCSGFHLILDQMWRQPQILFWPLLGLDFPHYDMRDWVAWLTDLIEALKSEPAVFVPEIIGALILILFAGGLLRSRGVLAFLKSGAVKWTTTTSS